MIPRAKPKRSYHRALRVLSPVKAATYMGQEENWLFRYKVDYTHGCFNTNLSIETAHKFHSL